MNTPKENKVHFENGELSFKSEAFGAGPSHGGPKTMETGVSGVMARDGRINVILKDADHCVATWSQTVIEIWRGAPTQVGVRHMMKACEKLLANGKGNVTYLAILERSSPAPSEPVRTILAQWSREIVPRMAGAVLVAEGGGFRAALVRGVGIALTALVPHRVPFKFTGTVEEAVNLLSPVLAASVGGGAALRSAVEKVHAEMDLPAL